MTFIVTTSGVITVGKMGRECNVVVCSFDVLGRNSMVCRGGGRRRRLRRRVLSRR